MSFRELLESLITLTVEQREIVSERISELNQLSLSSEQEATIQERRAHYRRSPESFILIDEIGTVAQRTGNVSWRVVLPPEIEQEIRTAAS